MKRPKLSGEEIETRVEAAGLHQVRKFALTPAFVSENKWTVQSKGNDPGKQADGSGPQNFLVQIDHFLKLQRTVCFGFVWR